MSKLFTAIFLYKSSKLISELERRSKTFVCEFTRFSLGRTQAFSSISLLWTIQRTTSALAHSHADLWYDLINWNISFSFLTGFFTRNQTAQCHKQNWTNWECVDWDTEAVNWNLPHQWYGCVRKRQRYTWRFKTWLTISYFFTCGYINSVCRLFSLFHLNALNAMIKIVIWTCCVYLCLFNTESQRFCVLLCCILTLQFLLFFFLFAFKIHVKKNIWSVINKYVNRVLIFSPIEKYLFSIDMDLNPHSVVRDRVRGVNTSF